MKYYFKIRAELGNPVHTAAVTPRQELLFQNKGIPPILTIRAKQMMAELGVERGYVNPDFWYRLLHITEPTLSLAAPEVNLELAVYPKKQTSLLVYQALFTEVAHDQYQGFEHIYTDGSKGIEGVGSAAMWGDVIRVTTLPKVDSNYTAEK